MAKQNEHGIAWTNQTWNPSSGCSKVSQGCKHCYAERLFPRVYPDRPFTDVRTHSDRLEQPLHWRQPRRVFVNSMSDLFHDKIPDWFIANVFSIMETASHHTYQILTKRPERMMAWVNEYKRQIDYMADAPIPSEGLYFHRYSHVWLGVSIENQETADARIPLLLRTPAAVRFLSVEPFLAPIDLSKWIYLCPTCDGEGCDREDCWAGVINQGISWLICGGESGPRSRPMHPDWVRSIRIQCQSAGIAFFMKQGSKNNWRDYKNFDSFPYDLQVREFPQVAA